MAPCYILIHASCMTLLLLDVVFGWWRHCELLEDLEKSVNDTCADIFHGGYPGLFLIFHAVGTVFNLLQVMILTRHLWELVERRTVWTDHVCFMATSLVLQYITSYSVTVVNMLYQKNCGCNGQASSGQLIEIVRCLVTVGKLLLFQWILHRCMQSHNNGGLSGNTLDVEIDALTNNERRVSKGSSPLTEGSEETNVRGCGFCFNTTSSAAVGVFVVLVVGYVAVMTVDVVYMQCPVSE